MTHRGENLSPQLQDDAQAVPSGLNPNALIYPAYLREAIVYYTLALSLYPNLPMATQQGHLSEMLSDFEQAIIYYQHALTLADTTDNLSPSPIANLQQSIQRCQQKLDDTYNPMANMAEELSNPDSGEALFDMVQQLLGISLDDTAKADIVDDVIRPKTTYTQQQGASQWQPEQGISDIKLSVYQQLAEQFTWTLVQENYVDAHTMLSPSLQLKFNADTLQEHFIEITDWLEEIEQVTADDATTDPDFLQNKGDVAWVYTHVLGSYGSEALSLTIANKDDKLCINAIEWGRP